MLPALFAILRDLKDLAFDVSALPSQPSIGRTNTLTRLVPRQTMKRNLCHAQRKQRG